MYKVFLEYFAFTHIHKFDCIDKAYNFVDEYISTISENVGSDISIKLTLHNNKLIEEWLIEKNCEVPTTFVM